MSNYKAPGVYVQDVVSGSQSISQASSSIGILIGTTRSGKVGVAQKIGSWTEFISKYANGLDTPFLENSYLPYAVHGFFTNGGKELYIGSIKKNAKAATSVTTTTVEGTTSTGSLSTKNNIVATASSVGDWGNSIKIKLEQNKGYDATTYKAFDVTVSIGTNESVTVADVLLSDINGLVMANSKVKQWLSEFKVGDTITELAEEEFTLAGGSDGDKLEDTDYTNALTMIDVLDDVTMVAIPGQTSKVVNEELISYCDNNGLFPILDMPMGSEPSDTKSYRKSITAFTGALAYPWGKVSDPLTNTLKTVPTAGHLMGVYARIISNRGVHKAPAGVDAQVRGFIEMEYQLTPTDISSLNPIGVICITSRPNAGIVLWGARSLNSIDSTMRYVSDGLLNLNIKKSLYDGTQFAVFEPNDEQLWSKVQATCKAFLETLRTSGALKGSAEEAYYVTVDSTNNTDISIADGELNIEVGYAPVKPAEFVVIKLAHSIVSE